MKTKLHIHSIIDVITNSSTEIFSYAADDAVEKCHEMINEILKIAGSDKKSEDLFSVYIEPADWGVIWNNIVDEDYEIEDLPKSFDRNKIKKFLSDMNDIKDYKETNRYFDNNVVPYLRENNRWKEIDCEDYDGYDRKETTIIIESKNGEDNRIIKLISGLFHEDAVYC